MKVSVKNVRSKNEQFTKDILKKTLRFALWIARNFIKVKTEAIKSK